MKKFLSLAAAGALALSFAATAPAQADDHEIKFGILRTYIQFQIFNN